MGCAALSVSQHLGDIGDVSARNVGEKAYELRHTSTSSRNGAFSREFSSTVSSGTKRKTFAASLPIGKHVLQGLPSTCSAQLSACRKPKEHHRAHLFAQLRHDPLESSLPREQGA